jgi:hypothetical protein
MRLMFVLGFLTLIGLESIHLHHVRKHTCEVSVKYSYQQFDSLLKLDSLINLNPHDNLRRALQNELLNSTLNKCGSVIR